MSLNGLSAAAVNEAFDQAIVDAGGWSVHECMYGVKGEMLRSDGLQVPA